jgi:hypothetical protein
MKAIPTDARGNPLHMGDSVEIDDGSCGRIDKIEQTDDGEFWIHVKSGQYGWTRRSTQLYKWT